jgi:hypothetical protein
LESRTEVRKLELEKTSQKSCHCLHYWEEAIGPLESIWKEDDLLKAIIGKVIVTLPLELEQGLKPLLGCRIAILRTDIPVKEYLFRVIPEKESELKQETGQMFACGLCYDEQISNAMR